jgi:GNAT superfamily N-acetyltransferase
VTADPLCTVRLSGSLIWRAHDGGELAGTARAWLRPDRRWFVWFEACREDCYSPLLAMVASDVGGDLYASVDEADEAERDRLARLGFTELRREGNIVIPVGEGTGLSPRPALPAGLEVISARDADEDRLRELDTALRADVPGSDGWRWDPADFRAETYESKDFDPATYLVAVDRTSGEYAGLVRIWLRPASAKLGLIAMLPSYRRQGAARALLAAALEVVRQRGITEVSADVDDTNPGSLAVLAGFGGRRSGGSVELIRRPAGS